MKQQNYSEKTTSWDPLKWIFVAAVAIGGIGLNYYFGAQPLTLRLLGWIAIAAVAAGTALTTTSGAFFLEYARESRVELRKVVWPTREETVQTTMLVIAFVIVLSLILWCFDSILMWILSIMTGQRG